MRALIDRARAEVAGARLAAGWEDEPNAAELRRLIRAACSEARDWMGTLELAARAQRLKGTEAHDILQGTITALARLLGILEGATPQPPTTAGAACTLCARPFATRAGDETVLRDCDTAFCERCVRACRTGGDGHSCPLCAAPTAATDTAD